MKAGMHCHQTDGVFLPKLTLWQWTPAFLEMALNTHMLMETSECILYFVLLLHASFTLPIKLSLSQAMILSLITPQVSEHLPGS